MQHVNHTHADYDEHAPKWKRVRDVVDGQDAVHKAGIAYLPKLKDQETEDYNAYVKRAGFYNATWRTIAGLSGMMFRKPPKVEIPAAIDSFMTDVDMAGTSLDVFARTIATEVLGPGRVGILVDHPRVNAVQSITVAVAEQLGLRPMLKTYETEAIINWKYARVRNRWVLSMVVLEETVSEDENEFKAKAVKQWRVLDLDNGAYRQRVFRKGEREEFVQVGADAYPLMRNATLDFIPFYIVGPDGIDSDCDEPPLIDLVDLNLSHYRTNADYEHGCHFTGLPTAVVSGYHPEETAPKLYIGSQAAWVFPDPNAKASFLEFTGQGLGALKDNLDRKEQHMAVLGARMLSQEKRAVEAAETAAIHRAGENSVLASIAQGVSEGITTALQVFADWAGATGKVVFDLNRDYNPAMLDAAQLTALMKMVQTGTMSESEHFDLMQRADIIDSEKTFEEHQEEISAQGPVAPVPVAANDVEAVA